MKKDKIISEEEQAKINEYNASELFAIRKAQRIKDYDFKKTYRKFTFWYWREKWRDSKQKRNTFLIFMQLRNGKMHQFRVSTYKPYFEKYDGVYYLDPDMVRHDVHSGLDILYFHQDISAPFRIDFDLDALHEAIRKGEHITDDSSIDKALNPRNLKGFMNSTIIEKILKGAALEDQLRLILILLIINLVITVILGIIVAKGMGMV